jgi:hypothetical protein
LVRCSFQVVRPPQRYYETVGGAVARDAEAKQLQYFVRAAGADELVEQVWDDLHGLERVWLHPASVNFKQASQSCRWMMYGEKVRTSKLYVRDTTEVSTYALLMFGGSLDAQFVQVSAGTQLLSYNG